jgi:hypothetical protein
MAFHPPAQHEMADSIVFIFVRRVKERPPIVEEQVLNLLDCGQFRLYSTFATFILRRHQMHQVLFDGNEIRLTGRRCSATAEPPSKAAADG